MIDDLQIVEAAQRADRIKAAMPNLKVSTDAIFSAIILGKRKPGRPALNIRRTPQKEPPPWFLESLEALKGQALTIGYFLMFSGKYGATKRERNDVGRWLRASGRQPRKTGGQQVFDI